MQLTTLDAFYVPRFIDANCRKLTPASKGRRTREFLAQLGFQQLAGSIARQGVDQLIKPRDLVTWVFVKSCGPLWAISDSLPAKGTVPCSPISDSSLPTRSSDAGGIDGRGFGSGFGVELAPQADDPA